MRVTPNTYLKSIGPYRIGFSVKSFFLIYSIFLTHVPKMDIQNRIEKDINRFIDEIHRISSAHRTYLKLCEQGQEDPSVLNHAPRFFRRVFEGLESNIIISLSKLFEAGRSDRNLLKLIRYVKHHRGSIQWGYKSVSLSEIEKHEKLITDQRDVIDHVINRRDKFHAHHDKEYFLEADKLLEDFPLDVKAIESLIDIAKSIVRDYYLSLTGGDIEITGGVDVGRVFRALEEYDE